MPYNKSYFGFIDCNRNRYVEETRKIHPENRDPKQSVFKNKEDKHIPSGP